MIRLVTWNVAQNPDCWEWLRDSDVDIALLQEAPQPGLGCEYQVVPDPGGLWATRGCERRRWRTAVVNVSGRFELQPHSVMDPPNYDATAMTVSRPGTLTVADVVNDGTPLFTVASMYGAWERPPDGSIIYADAMAHRLLSDLSQLVTTQTKHRLVAAGDLNILCGYGDYGDPYWGARYQSVFDRAEAMELAFVGPRAPHGRQADPWPDELPPDSRCVPTFHSRRQTPATATRQLDFVFASRSLGDLTARALNDVDEWGPSDHCRVVIDVEV